MVLAFTIVIGQHSRSSILATRGGELSLRWSDRNIQFRNLGWSGDTPTAIARGYFGGEKEGFKRLLEELDRIQPTVVFVCYG